MVQHSVRLLQYRQLCLLPHLDINKRVGGASSLLFEGLNR